MWGLKVQPDGSQFMRCLWFLVEGRVDGFLFWSDDFAVASYVVCVDSDGSVSVRAAVIAHSTWAVSLITWITYVALQRSLDEVPPAT